MINSRDSNIVNIFSYILNVSESIFHHPQAKNVKDIIICPIYHTIKAEKQLQ